MQAAGTEKTLKLLEFDIIRMRLASEAKSEEAREILSGENPLTDPQKIDDLKSIAAKLTALFDSGISEPESFLPSIGEVLPKLKVAGLSLTIEEAFGIGIFAERGGALIRWANTDGVLFLDIPDVKAVSALVFNIIDKDGKLRDLPELRAIKQRITALNRELQAAASSYTTRDETRRMLQSDVPSQRDGRLVLAVKANFRGRIKGIVHDVSQGGQTIFIEPEDIVEKNNDLLIEQRALDAEVRRIMRELTEKIMPFYGTLADFHNKIIEIECLRARARYAHNTKGIFAKTGSSFFLRRARHPLLGESAVPIDLDMGALRTVIITGPNTGGKTAALKTAGLLATMNQAGLAIPAAEGTILPVFDNIFADIGDDQSLSQSLSTFSAHISSIAFIIKSSTARSLVLLDELCSGTDPSEGSALAMAILDHFIEKKCRSIVTTHHSVLKNYGWTHSGVENASVDFDSATLSPSYRIVMGVPGESRALDIALHYGLENELVEAARKYLESGRADVSALIAGLKEKHLEADKTAQRFKEREDELREQIRKADLRELRLRQKETEIKAGAVGNLRGLLGESRKTLENLVRELKENGISREETLKVKEFLRKLDESVENEESELEKFRLETQEAALEKEKTENNSDSEPKIPIAAGVHVLAGAKRLQGLVKKKAKKGNWLVEVGGVSLFFSETELIPVKPDTIQKSAPQVSVDYAEHSPAVLELNVRGMRLQPALETLQKQIDAALAGGMHEFSVIHGKGDGILQKGVHEYLRNSPVIADYYFSRPELGGFGRTEVVLA
ncbi:endonuclease MutS2 [Spirochaetia bacterium]|nr:endonuclease MutS2 [Spirochaetia bacterium]